MEGGGFTLQCPHGDSEEEFPLYKLLSHLENCPSPCEEGGGGAAAIEEGGCDHLAMFDDTMAKIMPEKVCPHECGEEMQNYRTFPQHLESCTNPCDTLESGKCNHLSEVERILAELIHEHNSSSSHPTTSSNVDTPGTQALDNVGCSTQNRSESGTDTVTCPHEACKETVGTTVDDILNHLRVCDMPCTSTSDGCEHLNNIDVFCSEFGMKTNTNHVDHCNQIAEGQPPVFRPPPHASQEEIRHLRREHLQMVRSLTPEEKRQRQLMRNRRTARISKQRRQDHLKTLKLENSKLRQALQTLYSNYTSLRKRLSMLATDQDNFMSITQPKNSPQKLY